MVDPELAGAGLPLQPLKNLYLDYPLVYSEMIDGPLPDYFPAPIPDDGGAWAGGGNPADAGNRQVNDSEFDALAQTAEGAIVAGILTHKPPGDNITTVGEYAQALFVGHDAHRDAEVGDVGIRHCTEGRAGNASSDALEKLLQLFPQHGILLS